MAEPIYSEGWWHFFIWRFTETETVCIFGQRCILPCTFSPGDDILIHWLKTPSRAQVHSYYEDKDQLALQMRSFQNRTSLFQDHISTGNASLLLMWVKVEDQGAYLCYTSTEVGNSDTIIDLKVEGKFPPSRKCSSSISEEFCVSRKWLCSFSPTLIEGVLTSLSLQLWFVKSTSSRQKTASPAAQRGSTHNLSSAGPPTLPPSWRNHKNLKSSWWNISSTRSAPRLTALLIWATAAPSAPAETKGQPLCFKHVGVSAVYWKILYEASVKN